MKKPIQAALKRMGYQISSVEPRVRRNSRNVESSAVPHTAISPVWPLPVAGNINSPDQIRREFARYEEWHYAYEFEGGLSFPIRHNHAGPLVNDVKRPLLRFRHFMPYLMNAQKGSLKGKRVLDIACNSGFWSLQIALLGAGVVGFDARKSMIDQANLLKSIVGVSGAHFQVLDFWDMNPQALDGQFDVVLNLGILYHLPKPLEALQLTRAMSRDSILLDTEVDPSSDSIIRLRWEEPVDIRNANRTGIVALPSRSSIALMLRDIGAREWMEIPQHLAEMPPDYRDGWRASWLIKA